jgi:type IV pilus assembly protein PilQ
MTVEKLKKYREDSLSLESQEPLVSKTYPLNFAKAGDAMKVIDKLISKRGFINFDERTNAIIIRDLESNLDLITGVIKSIDTVTPQVSIEVKIVETDLTSAENLGVDWVNGITGTLTGGQQPTIFPFAQSNKGIPFLPSQTNFSNAGSPGAASSSSTGTSTGFVYGTINAQQLQATLQFLSTRTTTKILSNPRIVTLDNQKAKINVGEEYPEATYSFNSSTGNEQVTGFTTLPIGVNFEVTPHVNNAGLITLDVHPQISALLATVPQVGGAALPETSNQEAETNVMVEDGKTLVIGGLITDQTIVTTTKVPVLGDIPWLGKLLFRNINTSKTKKEMLIFLTPRIITVGKNSASTAIR